MSNGAVLPPSASDPGGGDPARFRRDLTAALGRGVAAGETLALAVSGGPDSMAMLWLAARAFPGQVIAATVDHQLRAESADEAAMVAHWCRGAGVAHATLAIEAPPAATGNLQSWARQERYLLLKRWAVECDAAVLCTAHHADDQAETFLMRAARATGLSGLAGIRVRQDEVVPPRSPNFPQAEGCRCSGRQLLTTLRPLLGWRATALRALCGRHAVPFVDDPSNRDPRFERARLREWLAGAHGLDVANIARTAGNLAAVDADFHAIGEWLWSQRAIDCEPDGVRLDMAGLPREVRRRLVRRALDHVTGVTGSGSDSRFAGSNVERLLDSLHAGRQAMQGDVLASAKGDIWHFRPAPPRRLL